MFSPSSRLVTNSLVLPPEGQRFARIQSETMDNQFRRYEKLLRLPPSVERRSTTINNKKPTLNVNSPQTAIEIIDFSKLSSDTDRRILDLSDQFHSFPSLDLTSDDCSFGFSDVRIERVFGIDGHPGLLIIPNPFSDAQQAYWMNQIIINYTINHPTNLSNLLLVKREERTRRNGDPPSSAIGDQNEDSEKGRKWDDDPSERIIFCEGQDRDGVLRSWPKDMDVHSYQSNDDHCGNVDHHQHLQFLKKVRWATLGFHFQWTPRIYTFDVHSPFPQNLSKLVCTITKQIGIKDFLPEAATLNFYSNPRYLMGGHVDDAEEAVEKPIVSISFGNEVVFLIGGKSREEKPTALLLRSGDVMIMEGESRLCYHGVPRMNPRTTPPTIIQELSQYGCVTQRYMVDSRLNVNVRQVFR